MTFWKKITNNKTIASNILFVLGITLLGTFLRIQYTLKTDFIMNDGGMFYTMILDLQKNGYVLPFFTTYNNSQIPFAYPPLSFYIAAILNQFLHIDLITVFRVFPLFYNVLSIPAFFFLAREITQNNRQSLLATAFYAILIPSYEWLISGGGLTRSPAQTFFILSLYFFLAFIRVRKKSQLFFSILAASLMTWHHLEYCWLLFISLVLFSIKSLSHKECLKIGSIFLVSVFLFTSPYWFIVLSRYGITPLISAFFSGEFSLVTSIVRLIIMVFTEETLINYINVMAIVGIFYCLFSRNYRLVIWFLLITFLNPRSANRSLIFPVSIFAAMTIDALLCPEMERLFYNRKETTAQTAQNPGFHHLHIPNFAYIFILFSIFYPFFLGFVNSFAERQVLAAISKPEREAMEWIKNNTPENSEFIIMDHYISWSIDKTGEWFPTLAQRKSLTTVQGTEWLSKIPFETNKKNYDELKKCGVLDETCLDTWSDSNHISFSHVYLTKGDCGKNSDFCLTKFETSMRTAVKYQKIFENDGAVVFKKEIR